MERSYGRGAGDLRPVTFEPGIAPHAAGSVLVSFGNTRVVCAATIDEAVPRWMQVQKVSGGWLTAEYSMLPYSTLDCDVLQADGGTRTAAITGACVAVELACRKLITEGKIKETALRERVAAVSVGVVDGEVLTDLDYNEDKDATVDMNLVMTQSGEFVEVQGSGEEATFGEEALFEMLRSGRAGIERLLALQEEALSLSRPQQV